MSERRRGLGRGLGALIPSAPAEETTTDQPEPGSIPPSADTTIEHSPDRRPAGEVSSPGSDGGRSPSNDRTDGTGRPNGNDGADRAEGTDRTEGAVVTGGTERTDGVDISDGTDEQARRASVEPEPSTRSAEEPAPEEPMPEEPMPEEPMPEEPMPVAVEADPDGRPAPGDRAETSGAGEHDGAGTASGAAATDDTPPAEPGRSASAARGRTAGPAARQKAMKARMDMGEAFRGTSLGTRPSDMFFLPSTPAAQAGASTESGESADDVRRAPGAPTEGTGPETALDRSADIEDGFNSAQSPGASETGDRPVDGHVSRETALEEKDLAAVPGATFAEVPVDAIHPNRKQPRQVFDEEELAELAYSIGELGVLQPIVVRRSRESGDPAYELVMGERRWRAAQRAGLAAIPAIVRETTDDSLLRDALLENLHRSQLNPLEEAAAYQQLMEEFGATQEELSRRIGRSRPQISNTIRLLRLPPLVQRRVAAGVLSSGHARALLSLSDPAAMERLAQRIVAEGLSVRATEEAVQLTEGNGRKPKRAAPSDGRHRERLNYIADAFADRLDTSVRIALGARKGKMTIEFASVDDLNRIIEVLDPGMDRQ